MIAEDGRRIGRAIFADVGAFGRWGLPTALRQYQLEVARAVARSVVRRDGLTFTVLFPRQAGKNEVSAQLEAFLLFRYQKMGGSIVKAAPTYRPQLVTSMRRLHKMLNGRLTRRKWRKVQGYIVEVGSASCSFFSAQPQAEIVGATASLLLEGDEAQDMEAEKWDRDLVPMAASGAATRVLYGTPWTEDTLLAREIGRNRELERRDGIKRHFEVGWETVAEAVPAYRRHVEGEIARLGEQHPIVRTQYMLRTLARANRLLSAEQLEKLRGEHPPLDGPSDGSFDRLRMAWGKGAFVAGIDVAGADEEDPEGLLVSANPRRDSTVVTIAYAEEALVEGTVEGVGRKAGVVEPRLYVVRQYAWRGAPHRVLYPVVLSLVRERWRCRTVVVDGTGVGSGLVAFLGAALGPRVVVPYVYTAASKSKLAYDFLAAVNAGRVRTYAPSHECGSFDESFDKLRPGLRTAVLSSELGTGEASPSRLLYELMGQAEAAEYELRANQVMRWSVPPSKGHDDLLNALVLSVQAGPVVRLRVARGRVMCEVG